MLWTSVISNRSFSGKRNELQAGIAALEGEAREASGGVGEVRDYADDATVAPRSTAQALEESTILARTLEEVEDALRRLADGSYGACTTCGRQIPSARLEAIPWTPFCLEDQQKLDAAKPAVRVSTL